MAGGEEVKNLKYRHITLSNFLQKMTFKAKLFKLGNSKAIYIPKSIYKDLSVGKEYEWEVYTKGERKENETPKVYTPKKRGRLVFNRKTGIEEWI